MLKFYAKWAPVKVEEAAREREYSAPEQPIIDEVDLGPKTPSKNEPASPLDDGFDDGANVINRTNSTNTDN